MNTQSGKVLLMCRQAPYSGQLARAALDAALASAVFDQDLHLFFMDDGVWQLLPEQKAAEINCKSIAKALDSMPLYDIETFYVDEVSLLQRGLDPAALTGNIRLVAKAELSAFLEGFDQVWSF
jgi:tRNA 2-thiouridine synthesizing protein C